MSHRIMLGGKEIYRDTDSVSNKDNRAALANLLTTKSTDSASAAENAAKLGGLVYAEGLGKLPAEMIVEVYERPEGKTDERIRAKYTVSALVKRIIAAVSQEERQGEIFPYNPAEGSTPKDNKAAGNPLDFLADFEA